jgi:hypothetical protein
VIKIKLKDVEIEIPEERFLQLFSSRDLAILLTKCDITLFNEPNELDYIHKFISKNFPVFTSIQDVQDNISNIGTYVMLPEYFEKNFGELDGIKNYAVFQNFSIGKRHCVFVSFLEDFLDPDQLSPVRNIYYSTMGNVQYTGNIHFCCFNQNSREKIVEGFKRVITTDEAMTGREFCELLKIDYDKIVKSRKKDQKQNMEYFVKEILKIKELKKIIIKELETEN